jgi:signal transduction histidine kinase
METVILVLLVVVNVAFLVFYYMKFTGKKSSDKIVVAPLPDTTGSSLSPDELPATSSPKESIYHKLLISLFERSSLGIILFDAKGSILSHNKSFTEILNLPSDILDVNYFTDLTELFPSLFSEEKREIKNFDSYASYDCVINIDNEEKYLRVNYFSLKVSESETALVVQIGDYTIYKKFELELINSKDEAENLNRMKSIFLANMSHEIRTPMNGIIGFAGLLREDVTEPNQIEMAERVYKSALRLMETLESVLDLSKLEAEHVRLEKKASDVNSIVDQVYHTYYDYVVERKLKFTITTPSHPVILKLDESILIKILKQLLSNAVKFTESGGIFLKVEEEFHNKNRVVAISVEDTGIGISLKNQEIIFDEFRQVSEGIGRNYDGVGIGLTIVKRFCEMINARISINSSPNSGSKFTLKFSDENSLDREETETEPFVNPEVDSQSKKILIVEDDFTNRELLKIYLSEYYTLFFAASAGEALRAVDKDRFDLCLIDINLGSKPNGVELLGLIRKKTNESFISIAMTAYYLPSTEKECLDAGFDYFVSKPLKRKKLLEIINSFLLD